MYRFHNTSQPTRKPFLTIFIFLILSLPVFSQTPVNPEPPTYDWVALHPNKQELKTLVSEGLLPDHIHSEDGEIAGAYRRQDVAKLRQLGIPHEVKTQNLAHYYEERLATPAPPTNKSQATAATPAAFNYGSMGGYLTFTEVLAELDSMAASYPNLVTVRDSIGYTHEGRAIWMVKISDNANTNENEPEAFYCGLHHAREPMSMVNLIYFMQYILENYGSDPLATYIIDNREMYFVPVVNPDGYVYNESTNPNGGGMWRKNRRDNGGGEFGVDLNRNYEYQFGFDNLGSSNDPASETYRGLAGFSEPESQAIRDLCIARDFKTALCYHSFGDLLIRPFGYDANVVVPDLLRYTQMGDQLVDLNNYSFGNSIQTVGYAANGVSDDWLYGEQTVKDKIYSFTPEVGDGIDGFWPPQSNIIPYAEENLIPNIRLAMMAGDYIDVDPNPYPEVAATSIFLPVDFSNIGLLSAAPFSSEFITNDPNILGSSGPLNIAVLQQGSTSTDSFALTLANGIPQGTQLCGVVRTTLSGGIILDDSVCFTYGIRQPIFTDIGNHNPFLWTGGWSTTTEKAYSGTQSITDSPNTDYGNNQNNILTSLGPIDLTNYISPQLQFRATWEIENNWDYVQVLVSVNGNTYQPLTGQYTNMGTGFFQPNTEQLYDGIEPNWVLEQIDLSPYAGQSIEIRFQLLSDGGFVQDGFYFDDLVVRGYPANGNSLDLVNSPPTAYLYPNPSDGIFRISSGHQQNQQALQLRVTDLSGRTLLAQKVTDQTILDLSHLAPGIYFSTLSTKNQPQHTQKIIIR